MSGSRAGTAVTIVKTMLNNLPREKRSSFNIYRFNTKVWSILPRGQTLEYDQTHVSIAINHLKSFASGGANIKHALDTVLGQRDTSKRRCSIIVVTDGLDWGVTAAMQTIQKAGTSAAANSQLLRVFVMGLGDDVSRSMCESLARAGSGATAYVSESDLQKHDHCESKAWTMINTINRAPIRVGSIDWGMTPDNLPEQPGAGGDNLKFRPQPDQQQLGPASKGSNIPPPKAIQQAPIPGTMFWAVRSSWYAIIRGTYPNPPPKVRIMYHVPGSFKSSRTIEVDVDLAPPGRLHHQLAARALVEILEDKAISITNESEKYWNECEIVRLGKTYSLASTQTSFVATMNGIGTISHAARNAPPDANRSPVSVATNLGGESSLHFVSTRAPATAVTSPTHPSRSAASTPTRGTMSTKTSESLSLPSAYNFMALHKPVDLAPAESGRGAGVDDNLSKILTTQDANGEYDATIVENIVFPSSGIPAVPAFIAILVGHHEVKDRMWHTICVIAFLRKAYGNQTSLWAAAKSKAENFIKTTLRSTFGVHSIRSESIYTDSLDDAESYLL
ncbi:hypothetical protein F5Y12DRAFT_776238 [Xylaria sp. FL1777]|nr:hypothetical protein F5Y12DRAFT_776238 [Xylaria sp. FL1777]